MKKFDCVKMKHDIQEQLYEELAPTSTEDYVDKLIGQARQSKLWLELSKKSPKQFPANNL